MLHLNFEFNILFFEKYFGMKKFILKNRPLHPRHIFRDLTDPVYDSVVSLSLCLSLSLRTISILVIALAPQKKRVALVRILGVLGHFVCSEPPAPKALGVLGPSQTKLS